MASAVHDVKHPGMNNTFQVNTFSNLALTHNDVAVLENEHSSHAFKLMIEGLPDEGDNLNFLSHVAPAKFAVIRERVVNTVLHTHTGMSLCHAMQIISAKGTNTFLFFVIRHVETFLNGCPY